MEGFRVVVVEDEPQSLRALVDLLEEELPTSRVDAATCRVAALDLICEARKTNRAYNLAIVDLFLPENSRGTPADYEPTFDLDFFRKVWAERDKTTVLLMTAREDDPMVAKYFAAMDLLEHHRYHKFIKRDNYTYPLLKAALDCLYGEVITQKIRSASQSRESLGTNDAMESGLTTRLAEIRCEIRRHWWDLSEETKDCIRCEFEVDDSVDPVSVRPK